MAAVASTERITMTLEEFLALPEQDESGNHFELDEGELITLSPTGAPHARRVAEISWYLRGHLDREAFDVLAGEAGILMAYNPSPIVRGMDIAVLYKQNTPERGMVRTPPLLIVEVISPGNNPVDLERKRRQYQRFGVEEIWFLYEDTKTVYVYSSKSTVNIYEYSLTDSPQSFQSHALSTKINLEELFR